MIPPLAGVRDLIAQLDGLAGARPFLPPLIVAVASDDDGGSARQLVAGFHDRLTTARGKALLPHALGAGPVLATVAAEPEPDLALIERLANQLSSTMPPGAGRWRLLAFETCRDVLDADVGPGLPVDRRRRLRDRLCYGWETRKPALAWARRMAEAASVPGRVLQVLLTAFFLGPNRWLFGRRLNSLRWRWLGEHVTRVTGTHGDFLDHALSLTGVRALRENAPLRRRILVDALVRDVERLTRRRRFLPHRRRRRWTPVLALDCAGPEGLACLDVLQSLREITADKQVCPLLMMAAMDRAAIDPLAGRPEPAAVVAERLQNHIDRVLPELPNAPWLSVLLRPEPEDRAVADWLGAHRKVNPRVPGPVSAWAPVALSVVVALAGIGVAAYKYGSRGCAQTSVNKLGERVGLTDGSCSLDPTAQPAQGYPYLPALERQIAADNAAVDQMRGRDGGPRDYRKVVFFAPLTRPANIVGRTVPANALWQLQGAVAAQQQVNGAARLDSGKVPVKLLLANSGDQFHDGPAVAGVIARQPRTGPGSVAGVIGISQSREIALQSINALKDLVVVGASVHGDDMTRDNQSNNFFMIAPADNLVAQSMVGYITQHGFRRAVIVHDPTDRYFSEDLHNTLDDQLRKAGVLPKPDREISVTENGELTSSAQNLTQLCEGFAKDGVVPVLTNRADEIIKVLAQAAQAPACADNHVTMVAGPGAIVAVAAGETAKYRGWLRLAYSALADTAQDSDRATGHDALLAVSTALDRAAGQLGSGNENAQSVLAQLGQSDFSIDGLTGHLAFDSDKRYDSSPGRVRMLTTP